jgi:hypothetical protein
MVLRPASILGCLPFDPFSVSAHEGFSMGVQVSFGTEDIKQDGIVLVRSIYRANKATEKGQYLEQFMDDYEVLKLEIRLSVDLKLITIHQQAELSVIMDGIGKQITGWRNASR